MDDESYANAMHDLQRTVDSLTADMLRRAPKTVPRINRRRRTFERGLRRHWGRGLDLYHLTLHQARELGSEINRAADSAERDEVFQALTRLHARACRIADEVYCLLGSGHGDGAMKSVRLLYEISAVSYVLGEYGRQPEHGDLIERYLAAGVAAQYKAMEVYQEHAVKLAQAPFSDAEMAEARESYDMIRARFGKVIADQFGWAYELPEKQGKKNTKDIAKLAGIDHLLPYVEWSAAEVHGGAHGLLLNTSTTSRGTRLAAGPNVAGLADPAGLALLCLYHCTIALVTRGLPTPTPGALVWLQVVGELQFRADAAFGAAHKKGERLPLIPRRA